MLEITSSTNSLFKKFLSLTESKGLKKEGLYLLSGKNLVAEFLREPKNHSEVESELSCKGMAPTLDLKKQVRLSRELFNQLDVLGTHAPLLVVRQPSASVWD